MLAHGPPSVTDGPTSCQPPRAYAAAVTDDLRPDRRRDRRSVFLAKLFATDARRPGAARRRRSTGVFVGWLVLMTVWGFGRAGLPGLAGLFLWAGLLGGAVTAYVIGWAPDRTDRSDDHLG